MPNSESSRHLPFRHLMITGIFSLTIFLSAFLLFFFQPMTGKTLLPSLGGSPAVWNTCMVFFQAMLLFGYAYAHFLVKLRRVWLQIAVHLAVILSPFALLPGGLAFRTAHEVIEHPVLWLLGSLWLSAGLWFFIVSTGSPLLQRWFSLLPHPRAHDPYFLYAASNAGSFLALLSYPFLVEPLIGLTRQRAAWQAGYLILVLLFAAVMILLFKRAVPATPCAFPPAGGQASGIKNKLFWVFLAFVPSSLMLGVTTYISADIAAAPLLWIIPLSLYLLTFIIAFSGRPGIFGQLGGLSLRSVAFLCSIFILSGVGNWQYFNLILQLGCFFLIAVTFHLRLAQVRPPADKLTGYFFLISLGGVLGGIFNALAAPVIFTWTWEYPLVLGLSCLLPFPGDSPSKPLKPVLRKHVKLLLAIALSTAALNALIRHVPTEHLGIKKIILSAPLWLAFLVSTRKPLVFALIVALLPCAGFSKNVAGAQRQLLTRSFFGIHRVMLGEKLAVYKNGTTIHALQNTLPDKRCDPLAYYGLEGPAGRALELLNQHGRIRTVGAIGLGMGAMASYAQAGQEWTFFEIDAAVRDIAAGSGYFTYTTGCVHPGARLHIEIGDGRALMNRVPDGAFDLIILDAFSSDAIPVHLLTREAFGLYLRKLAPRGAILIHISNRYFHLEPLIGNLAGERKLPAFSRYDFPITEDRKEAGISASDWILVFTNPEDSGILGRQSSWRRLPYTPAFHTWTDEVSSILSVLDLKGSFRKK